MIGREVSFRLPGSFVRGTNGALREAFVRIAPRDARMRPTSRSRSARRRPARRAAAGVVHRQTPSFLAKLVLGDALDRRDIVDDLSGLTAPGRDPTRAYGDPIGRDGNVALADRQRAAHRYAAQPHDRPHVVRNACRAAAARRIPSIARYGPPGWSGALAHDLRVNSTRRLRHPRRSRRRRRDRRERARPIRAVAPSDLPQIRGDGAGDVPAADIAPVRCDRARVNEVPRGHGALFVGQGHGVAALTDRTARRRVTVRLPRAADVGERSGTHVRPDPESGRQTETNSHDPRRFHFLLNVRVQAPVPSTGNL